MFCVTRVRWLRRPYCSIVDNSGLDLPQERHTSEESSCQTGLVLQTIATVSDSGCNDLEASESLLSKDSEHSTANDLETSEGLLSVASEYSAGDSISKKCCSDEHTCI